MSSRRPPRLPLLLVERFAPGSEPLIGDLVEEFSSDSSTWWLWWQVASAIGRTLMHRDDEIRPLRLVDLQPADAVQRTRTVILRCRPVNMAGSPLNVTGGLGLVVLAALTSWIAPNAWRVLLAALVAGVFVGVALIAARHSRNRTMVLCGLLAAGCLSTSAFGQRLADREPLVPIEATKGILDAFGNHTVVGLSAGADHGDARGPAFVASMIRDPRFRPTAIDVVVENANARYQDVMDRFTSGQDVPYDVLRHVWDDTTQPQTIVTDIPDVYRALREINASLPRGLQHRAILGDPPIDWNDVRTKEDFQKWLAQRDSYPAEAIQREVLSKGRRALVVYGSGHLQRKQQASNYQMDSPLAQTVISFLDRAHAKSLCVITVGDPFVPSLDASAWPVPSLARVAGTTLGAELVAPGALARVAIRDGRLVPIPREQWADLAFDQQFDAVLYLGPSSTRAQTEPSKAICDEPGYVDTRLKRISLAGLPPSVAKQVEAFCAK